MAGYAHGRKAQQPPPQAHQQHQQQQPWSATSTPSTSAARSPSIPAPQLGHGQSGGSGGNGPTPGGGVAGPQPAFAYQPYPHPAPPGYDAFDPALVPSYQLPPQTQPQQHQGGGFHPQQQMQQGQYGQQQGYPQQQQGLHPQQYAQHVQQHFAQQQQHQQQLHHQHQQMQQQQQQHAGGANGGQQQLSSATALLGLKRPHPSSGPPTPNLSRPNSTNGGTAVGSSGGRTGSAAVKKQRRQSSTSRVVDGAAAGATSEEEESEESEDEEDEDEDDEIGSEPSAKDKGKAKGSQSAGVTSSTDAVGKDGKPLNGKGKPVELGPDGKKPKATRGSRACTVCRKLKMRCFSEEGPPCKRCKATNQECIFEESNRGKKSTKKHEAMAQSLKKMEQTLDTVLRSIHNPAMAAFASGMVTRSPSPSGGAAGSGNATAAAMARLPMMPDGQTGLPGIRSIDSGASSHAGPGPSGSHHPGFTGELSGHHLGGSNGSPASNGRSHPTFYAPPVLPGAHPPPYPIPQHAHYQQPHHLHHPSGASLHALPISSASSSSAGGPASGSAGNPPLPNPPPPQVPTRPHSPRLHSLPDNSLNPLGLLAEASLHNHRKIEARGVAAGMLVRNLLNHEPTLQQQAPTPASSHASGGRGGSVTASTPARDGAGAGSVAGSNAATAAVEEADDEEARRRAADDEAITNAAIAKVHRVMGRRPPAPVGHGGSSDLRSRPPSPTAGASGESGSAAPGRPSAAAAYTAAAANSAASGEPGSTAAGISSTNGDGKGKEQEARPVAGSREADAKAVKDEPAVEDDVPLGLASTVYFKPGPMTMLPLRRIIIERSIRPEILDFLSTDEVLELFSIYFDYINVQVPVLDRAFHTPGLVASRSPFLLTTVCWVASKFYSKRPELVGRLNTCVRKLAFETPSHGFKSVEIVQAYLILTCYGLPVERFELDQAWLLLGMGIRVATDLNLHRKSQLTGKDTEEAKARDREIINRERTWLMCYVLDRSLSSQMGKPYSIREDFIIRNKTTWAASSAFATYTDRGLVAYVGLQQIMSRALDFIYSGTSTASGLQTDLDYPLFLRSIEAQLSVWDTQWHEAWDQLYNESAEEDRPKLGHSRSVGSFYCSYALLMMNSFGLQNALERAPIELGHFFARVAGAAMEVIKVARDELAPTGKLTYAPDSTFTMLSYAILSLLKLLRPQLTIYLESPAKILEAVHGAVKVLEEVAIDSKHTPALHAQLLRSLLSSTESRPNSVPNTPYPTQTRFATRQNSPVPTGADGLGVDTTLAPTANGAMSAAGGTSPVFTDWTAAFGGTFPEGEDFGYSTFGGADGVWGGHETALSGGEGSLNLEAIWPANSGIFDSHLLPGWNPSMELTGGTVSFGGGGSFTPQVASPTQSHARRMTGD